MLQRMKKKKKDRVYKGPASSQPHRLQGSLINRLMGNSTARTPYDTVLA